MNIEGLTAAPGPLLPGRLADLLGWHLARAALLTTAEFERHVGGPFALRKVEFSLLMLLLANGAAAPKALAQALALTGPKLTLLLDRLQDRGLLARERNPADGRSQHIVLTDVGRRLAQDAAARPLEQGLAERLSRAEQAMLIELLGKLGPPGQPGGAMRASRSASRLLANPPSNPPGD